MDPCGNLEKRIQIIATAVLVVEAFSSHHMVVPMHI